MAKLPEGETEIVQNWPDLANEDWRNLFSPKDLTDADWVEVENLKQALELGGQDALQMAFADLRVRDPICWFRIIRSFFPTLARQLWLKLD